MTAYPGQTPDDTGRIVHHTMGLAIMAGCDTAWKRTSVCSDASSTEIQSLRPLRHSGAQIYPSSNSIHTLNDVSPV